MRNLHLKEVLKSYIISNYKEYLLVLILFLIGLFAGVLIINNCKETQISEISTYLNEFITRFKETQNIKKSNLITTSIKNNTILTIILWAAGTTVIGIPIVLAVILYRGLTLGFTISAITYTLGTQKGLIFCFITILLQNIIFIPAILTLGVSSIKLYKSIVKDRQKNNIKAEIFRHTIISTIMLILLTLSSLVENMLSLTILQKFIKYF